MSGAPSPAIRRLHVGARLSEVAIHRGTVYLAGQVADDATLDIEGQTRQVLGHVDRLLQEAGSARGLILAGASRWWSSPRRRRTRVWCLQ